MIRDTVLLLVELVALFFGVALLVHLAQRRLGAERLRRWLGGSAPVAALKGIAIGFVTPFCTYSAIPLLVGLHRAGVPAGYVAFIVAAPVLDPILFGALVLIVGLPAALAYTAVAFTGAMTLALVAQRSGVERFLERAAMPSLVATGPDPGGWAPISAGGAADGCAGAACEETAGEVWRGIGTEAVQASVAAGRLLRSLGPILLLGVGIGLAIESLLPPGVVASIAGEGDTFAIPVAAALGTPLYFSTGLFVPIAESLASVGVGAGAIVALTIAGAGANIPEFVILSRLAKNRVIAVFVVYVFAVAMAGGVLAQAITG